MITPFDEESYDSKTLLGKGAKSSNSNEKNPSNWMNDDVKPTGASEAENTQPQTNPNIPRMMLYTRVINFGLSICMIIASLLSILTTTSATTGVLACYVTVFACLLCCFETHLKQVSKVIAENFGFLYSAKSRAIFMVFVGTLMFSFSLFGMLVGALMIANAGFNLYIIFTYPDYDAVQRKDAQAEINEYLQANPAFATQVVSAGVSATTDFAARNPDLARQGAQTLLVAATLPAAPKK